MSTKKKDLHQVTIFHNRFVTSQKDMEVKELSLRDLGLLVLSTHARRKDDLPLLKFARMGDIRTHGGKEKSKDGHNGFRNDTNVLSINGVEMDYDRGVMPFKHAVSMMQKAKVTCLMYTSSSHTEEKPRWRILAPSSKDLKPKERAKLAARINGIFGGIFGNESFVLSQSFHYGSVIGNEPTQTAVVNGRFIDQCTDLSEIHKGETKVVPDNPFSRYGSQVHVGSHVGFDAKLSLIGDHDGGQGFNSPITAAIAAFISEHGEEADVDEMKDRIRSRVAEAEKDDRRDTDSNMKRYVSDTYLDECIHSALAKFGATPRIKNDVDGPTFRITDLNVPVVADKIIEHWVKTDVPIYLRGGLIVDPVETARKGLHGRPTTAITLHEVPVLQVYSKVMQTVKLEAYKGNKDNKEWVSVKAPEILYGLIHARGPRNKLHDISGLISSPTLRWDGSVLNKRGYDDQTGLYLSNDMDLPPIKKTKAAAIEALDTLKSLLVNYPFLDDMARTVALAGILSVVCRGAFPRHPIFVTDAPKAGTGKSHLLDLISVIGTGRRMPVVNYSHPEENAKAVGALLIVGQSMICFDNCNGRFGGSALCQSVTQDEIDIRILGLSKMARVNTLAMSLFANGNNIQLEDDIIRRCIKCQLDAQMENPYQRTFSFDPIQMAEKDRPKYVAAALTICSAYSSQKNKVAMKPLASFEEWSSIIRGSLIWLGCPDIATLVDEASFEDDNVNVAKEIFSEIYRIRGETKFRARDLVSMIDPMSDSYKPAYAELAMMLRGALMQHGKPDPRGIGDWLKRHLRAIVGSYRLDFKSDPSHGSWWWITCTDKTIVPFPQTEPTRPEQR